MYGLVDWNVIVTLRPGTAQGKSMQADFADPDFIIAAETLGDQCGVALLTRALRERYRFVQAR